MLDNCSQGSFVKTNLQKELKVQGINTSVTIKTLNGDFKHSTRAIEGLEVSNADWKKEEWINLPRMFSQNELPTELDEIATRENIKQWKYLHRIISEMKTSGNLDVQLLIVANCLKALEPQEVITSKGDGPYTFRARLGLDIVSPIAEKRQENRFYCNRISVRDCRTRNSSRHHFAISEYKKEGIGDLLKRMYDTDFVESQVLPENGIYESLSEVSVEDLFFLKSVEEKCSRYENHYVLELPFRNKVINLPNNRWMGERRFQSLKEKFSRDEKFHQDYKNFMEILLKKGYATVCSSDTETADSWYIPHHGVYHPNKLDKIR